MVIAGATTTLETLQSPTTLTRQRRSLSASVSKPNPGTVCRPIKGVLALWFILITPLHYPTSHQNLLRSIAVMSPRNTANTAHTGSETMEQAQSSRQDTISYHRSTQTEPEDQDAALVVSQRQTLLSNIANSLSDSRYSDLILIGKKKSFKVHQVILCPQSSWTTAEVDKAAAGGGQAKTKDSTQPKIMTIHVPCEIDDETMSRIVTFYYRQDYDHSIDAIAQEIKSGGLFCNVPQECPPCKRRLEVEVALVHDRVASAGYVLRSLALRELAQRRKAAVRAEFELEHGYMAFVMGSLPDPFLTQCWSPAVRSRKTHEATQALPCAATLCCHSEGKRVPGFCRGYSCCGHAKA